MRAYLDVIFDVHHIVAELFWTVGFDLCLIPVVRWAVRRHDRREHGA